MDNFLSLYDQQLRKKIIDLYHGRFLRTIRFSQQDSTTFVTGRVFAEMSKNCICTVDVSLDRHGIVQESQCECTAGAGPYAHCKHVALVLFAVSKAKEGILTKETCTQTLQSFHRSKNYGGSPVKMQSSKTRTDGKLSALANFDPRPVDFRMRVQYPCATRPMSSWPNSHQKISSLKVLAATGIAHSVRYLQLFRPLQLTTVNDTTINSFP